MTENSKSEKNLVLRYSTHASQAYACMRQGDDQAKVTVGHLAFHRPAAMLLGSGERSLSTLRGGWRVIAEVTSGHLAYDQRS